MRTSELIAARWEEIDPSWRGPDGDHQAVWTVPAERMKGKRGIRKEHLVPLSRQAAAILQAQSLLTGPKGFVFKSLRTSSGDFQGRCHSLAATQAAWTKASARIGSGSSGGLLIHTSSG